MLKIWWTSKRWRVQFSEEPQFVCSFLLPQGGRCWPITLSYMFFLRFLYVPRNEQTKTPQNAIWRWYLLKANITSDRKRQHTKSPFFRRNLWCFGRYQEIGETYACFQVARFPGFGVLTYRTFHGTMDELRVSMTNGLKVWFDGVASPFWIIIHSFVAQQVLALILVYRYLETIFIINHSIGPSVLIQLYIYGNWMKFRWFLNSSQNAMFFLWKANGQRKQAHFLKESFPQKHSHKSADWQV